MDWLTSFLDLLPPYLPPIMSIILIGISGLNRRVLETMVDNYETTSNAIKESKTTIKLIASDWAERLGFYDSMIISMISSISLLTAKNYGLAVLVTFIYAVGLYVAFKWTGGYKIGEFGRGPMWRFPFSKVVGCRIILVLANVGLILLIYISQPAFS